MSYSNHNPTWLTRSNEGVVAGICEGLGRHFGISPNLLRLLWAAAVLFLGTGLLLYLVMWWIVPREDEVPLEPMPNDRDSWPLQRTSVDRKILGVCGGLARRWDIDPSLLRLVVLSLATLSFGIVAVLYFVAAIVMPGPKTATHSHRCPVEL